MPTLLNEERPISAPDDDRAVQARHIAEAIGHDVSERAGEVVELAPHNGSQASYDVLWNGERTGRVNIYVPRGTYGPERTRFALQPPSGGSRNYTKQSTLVAKINALCRPASETERDAQRRRDARAELDAKIEAIEGGSGAIQRYLVAHRGMIAAWLADMPEESVPPSTKTVVDRMRKLVLEVSRLRAEQASLE